MISSSSITHSQVCYMSQHVPEVWWWPHGLGCWENLAVQTEDCCWMASAGSTSQTHLIYCCKRSICKLFYLLFYSAHHSFIRWSSAFQEYHFSGSKLCTKQNASKITVNFRSGSVAWCDFKPDFQVKNPTAQRFCK